MKAGGENWTFKPSPAVLACLAVGG